MPELRTADNPSITLRRKSKPKCWKKYRKSQFAKIHYVCLTPHHKPVTADSRLHQAVRKKTNTHTEGKPVVGSSFNQDWAAFSFQRMMKTVLKAADTGGSRTTGRLPAHLHLLIGADRLFRLLRSKPGSLLVSSKEGPPTDLYIMEASCMCAHSVILVHSGAL